VGLLPQRRSLNAPLQPPRPGQSTQLAPPGCLWMERKGYRSLF